MDAPEQARSQVTRLAELQSRLAVVRADRDAFAALIEQLRSDTTGQELGGQSPSRRLMAFPTLLQNQSASVLLGALAQAETQRADLLIRRTPQDSDVQVLTARIREIETQLRGIAESFEQSLANQVTSLTGEAAKFQTTLDALPDKELETARLQREVTVLNDLWVLVQTRLKEAEITGAVADPTVRVVDAAAPPARPSSPKLRLNLALGLVLGAMIGVLIALAREYADHAVRSRTDVRAASGLAVLAAIPRVSGPRLLPLPWRRLQHNGGSPNGNGAASPARGHATDSRHERIASIASLLVTEPGTPLAYVESFNQLFANLTLSHRSGPLSVVVMTSALPGEGKTLSAMNFALIGASWGLRMLLVDADLRSGMVSAVLGCEQAPGFSELLAGVAQANEVIREVTLGTDASIMVIPTGNAAKGGLRVLTLNRVRKVLRELAGQVDCVVIDTPPVNLLSDAALLGSAADAVVLVVRAGQTRTEDLQYAMYQLEEARAPFVGTLLNDIDLRRDSRYDGAYRYLARAAAHT